MMAVFPDIVTLYNRFAVHWGLYSALRGVQSIEGISPVHWSALEDVITALGISSVHWGISSVHWGDIISAFGGISRVHLRGYHECILGDIMSALGR